MYLPALLASLFLLSIVSVLLNTICLYILNTSTWLKEKASSCLLRNLLVVHLFQGLAVLPLYGAKKMQVCDASWSQIIANAFRVSYMLCFYGNSLGVLCVSFDRYLAAKLLSSYKVLVTKRSVERTLTIIWIYIISCCLIPFVNLSSAKSALSQVNHLTLSENNNTCTEIASMKNGTCVWCKEGFKLYFYTPTRDWVVFMLSCNTGLPYIIIVLCYIYIMRRLKSVTKKYRAHDVQSGIGLLMADNLTFIRKKELSKYKRLTALTFLITITYGVLWTPSIIYYLLIDVCQSCFPLTFYKSMTEKYLGYTVKYLAFLNAAVTPALYCFFHAEFRRSLWKRTYLFRCFSGDAGDKGDCHIQLNRRSPTHTDRVSYSLHPNENCNL